MSTSCVVSLKVELRRQPTKSTFHRFSGAYTFATLRSVIDALVGDSGKAPRYVIEYTDEDKDQIRLTSEAEWEECLRVFEAAKTPLLRLVVSDPAQKRQSGKQQSKNEDPRRTSQPKDPFTPLLESLFGRGCGASSTKAPGHQDPCAFLQAVLGGVAGPAASGGRCCAAKKNSNGETSTPKHDITSAAAMDLLSLIYGCDARAELERGDISTPALRRGLSRVFNPFTGEVRLTVDSATLYGDAVTKGNNLIESHDLGEAEHVLRLALEVFAKSAIFYYNLACVLSLQGRLDEAIDVLLVAKSHGYNDVQHLQQDPDLENARDHPRFVELAVAQESKQNGVSSTASEATSSSASSSSEDVVALLGMFPDMSAQEATNALARACGDVARAVNGRLAGYW